MHPDAPDPVILQLKILVAENAQFFATICREYYDDPHAVGCIVIETARSALRSIASKEG